MLSFSSFLRIKALALILTLVLTGCDAPYYWQAAKGQWNIISQQQNIAEIINNPSTPQAVREKLRYLLTAREFAVEKLNLTGNDSYLTYVDLKRDHVVWNVFATPELSMNNKTWCYPIAGCVSYRGYFSEQDALSFADELSQQGFDTYVGGVGAYSTLGWFEDPVLNTFITRTETALAALLFHELAHQTLYVKDDTVFNESYASSIEQILLQQWLSDAPQQWQAYLNNQGRHNSFLQLVLNNKQQREALFNGDLSDQEKRDAKAQSVQQLWDDYQRFKQQWNGYNGYDHWFEKGLNNAQLSTVATYNELLPGFMALYKATNQNLSQFIKNCESLADLSKKQRHQRLKQFANP